MTGSLLFHRQYSSTAGNSMVRPKLRRWSSADDHNLSEVIPDDNQYKERLPFKRNQTPSDSDSGVEDLDQPVGNFVSSESNNVDEEEPSTDFGACEEENFEEHPILVINEQLQDPEQQGFNIYNTLILAARVPDSEKKGFCRDTMEVFHAEFARLLSYVISLHYPGICYHLFSEEETKGDPCEWPSIAFVKLDNAKAQFKCPNIYCRRLWTSMRARISFKISHPQPNGFVVLKIYGQNCEHCQTPADALWYMEEVCRVMKNLAKSILDVFFPSMINYDDLQDAEVMQNVDKPSRRIHHDPHQRKGKMHAPHNKSLCEACKHGWCFA